MRHKQIVALALASAVSAQASPMLAFSPGVPGQSQGTGSLAGTSKDAAGSVVSGVKVQLRDLGTGQLAGTTTSDAVGQFSFSGLQTGNYAIELVNASGTIIGTSGSVAIATGSALSGLTVTAAAAQAALAAATAGGLSTALIVTTAAAGAGVAALVVVKNNASPSQ